MKRISDKMRLDWMEDWARRNSPMEIRIVHRPGLRLTLRESIDAAIAASKRARGKSKPEKDNCPKCHCPWSAHDKIYGCTTGDAGGGSCGCRERKSKRGGR